MNLKVEIIKENLFILLEDVDVEVLGYKIIAKAGFDFDGASIPKALWSLYGNPLSGNFKIAALIHDALYASQILDRKICDEIFLELMKLHGVGYIKRYSMYNAVKALGGVAWEDNQDELEKYKKFVNLIML